MLLAHFSLSHAQLSLAYNRPRAGDKLVKYQVEYKDPGPSGENVLWDFSKLKTVNGNYTVTYSAPQVLGDSLYVLGSKAYLLQRITKVMSRKYKFYNPEGVYFVSFAVKEWIDVELLFLSKHKAQVDTCASGVGRAYVKNKNLPGVIGVTREDL